MNTKFLYKLEGIITSKSRITQSGTDKAGAHAVLPRQDVWFENDTISVPYISANSIRGKLRRLIMDDLCELLGYKFTDDKIWHAFFGGGQLKGGGDGMIDVEFRQKITTLIPPVGLWAFSLGNQMIEGKLIVYDMVVCCEENKNSIPEIYHKFCSESFNRYIGSVFFTRKDDSGNVGQERSEEEQAIQMKVEVQCFIPATRFYHGFVLRKRPTEIEIACLHRALNLWNEYPTIGGKASSGYGQIELKYDKEFNDKPYLEYIKIHKTEIIAYLDKISQDFQNKQTKAKTKKKKSEQKTLESGENVDANTTITTENSPED